MAVSFRRRHRHRRRRAHEFDAIAQGTPVRRGVGVSWVGYICGATRWVPSLGAVLRRHGDVGALNG